MSGETRTETNTGAERGAEPRPCIVIVLSAGRPQCTVLEVSPSRPVVIGRSSDSLLVLPDERLSREHVSFAWDGARWTIRDLGSRNGTFVDGEPLAGSVTVDGVHVVRAADTVFVLRPDASRFQDVSLGTRDAPVAGPSFRHALAQAGRARGSLLVLGETGTGKELAARHFHGCSGSTGPFVAVNCATIPEGVAERLLFGSVRGAYSGASDAQGHVQSAATGTLFLDEIGELDPAVQAKLLRFVETREATPLGASVGKKIDLRLVFATNRDLRAASLDQVQSFRADLFHRIAEPSVTLPPLRDRREEIPWHVAHALEPDVRATARFVEACMLRSWPGNVRELRAATRAAAAAATQDGERTIRARHLDDHAGIGASDQEPSAALDRDQIEAALARASGNVSAAARALGLHRTQLYRAMKRHGLG